MSWLTITIVYKDGLKDRYHTTLQVVGEVVTHHLRNPNVVSIHLTKELAVVKPEEAEKP
jgi:hypothetical protein